MKIPPMSGVECAILHDEFAPIDSSVLLEVIKHLVSDVYETTDVRVIPSSNERHVHIFAAGNRILLSQNAEPLEAEGFQSSLHAPITQMMFPQVADSVEAHKASTVITVAKGMVEPAPDLEVYRAQIEAIPVEDRSFMTAEEAEKATRICAELARVVTAQHAASAVHWCPSDFLLPQGVFEQLSSGGDYTMLGIRPSLTSTAGKMGEGLPLGMIATGSQWLIGKLIVFEEAPVTLEWLMKVIPGFIHLCRARGSVVANGDTFTMQGEDWVIAVLHKTMDEEDILEKIVLKLIHAPAFGIQSEQAIASESIH